jgi:alkylation response protein AidB-like acyl-CoA dehydrogenase
MNFDLTEDQQMLAQTVRDFAEKSSPVDRFRRLRDGDGPGWEASTWKEMGELGWLSVPFPESVGGFGGSFADVALVLEQLGRTLVPEPYLASVVLGGMSVLTAGNAEQHSRFLSPLIAGDATLALAYLEPGGRYAIEARQTRARAAGAGYTLEGEKRWVLGGHAADHLVVSADTGGGTSLFVVDREAPGVEIHTVRTLDGHRSAMVRFDGVAVERDRLLGQEGSGAAVLERVVDWGAAAAVAEGLGICQAALDMTVDYLKTREQFGVKIGVFQALQHRAVDMFVETELLRSIATEAMVAVDSEDAAERQGAVSAAKVQLDVGARWVLQECIQLHGGIGVTDEADVGLFFKRLHALNALFGDEHYHVGRYANLPTFMET